jgi:hypothetical protein
MLLALLVIVVDPNARQKAVALVNRWNREVVAIAPSVSVNDSDHNSATPVPTLTPIPTAVAGNHEGIPNTGTDETHQPIIQINWDALNAALQRFWNSLRHIKINLNPSQSR